jgi:hypothetical protein
MRRSHAHAEPDNPIQEPGSKWPGAVAGAVALGLAAAVQFAGGGLSDETVAGLSPVLAQPYRFAGNLCLTLPLAGFGLVLLGAAVFAPRRQPVPPASPAEPRTVVAPQTIAGGKRSSTLCDIDIGAAWETEEELETGEPLEEEDEADAEVIAVRPARPARPAVRPTPGAVELVTAKYLARPAGRE